MKLTVDSCLPGTKIMDAFDQQIRYVQSFDTETCEVEFVMGLGLVESPGSKVPSLARSVFGVVVAKATIHGAYALDPDGGRLGGKMAPHKTLWMKIMTWWTRYFCKGFSQVG